VRQANGPRLEASVTTVPFPPLPHQSLATRTDLFDRFWISLHPVQSQPPCALTGAAEAAGALDAWTRPACAAGVLSPASGRAAPAAMSAPVILLSFIRSPVLESSIDVLERPLWHPRKQTWGYQSAMRFLSAQVTGAMASL